MDDEESRKKYTSLPENYVSLVQLKERWLQKQEEERRKKKQLEKQVELQRVADEQKRENENDHKNTEICKDEKNGRQVGSLSVGSGRRHRLGKDEQKMRVKIGGFNGDGRMGGMGKEKRKKGKSRAVGKHGDVDTKRAMTLNEEEKQVPGNNIEQISEGSSGKNSVRDGFTGETASVCTAEFLVENGGRAKIEGFSRSNWNKKGYKRGMERNDRIGRMEYKLKEKIVETNESKGNGELKLEEKGRERIVIRTRFPEGQSRKKMGYKGGFRRNGKNESTVYKLKEKGIETDESKGSEDLTSDKEERERNEYGVWFRGNDKNGRIDYETKQKWIEIDELKGIEELESDNKERERNEFRRNGKNMRRGYMIKDHGVEGEDINGTGITLEKVAEEVLVGKGEENDAKGGAKNGYRRKENMMGKIGRGFGNLTLNDRGSRNRAPRVDRYGIAGGRRMYGNRERFGDWNVNQRYTWVKKQENSDGNAAQIGFSGM